VINDFVKNCVCCNIEFTVKRSGTARGSSNFLRKKYCSLICKKEFTLKNSSISYFVNCLNCNFKFKTYPSVKSVYCSDICRQKQHSQKIKKRKLVKVDCQYCLSKFDTFDLKKKFCNNLCKKNFRIAKYYKECCCKLCNKIFLRKKSAIKSENVFCNRKCQFFSQSCGLIKVNTCSRQGERIDLPGINFKSSFEADFMRYSIYKKQNVIFEYKTFTLKINEKSVNYTPDFFDVDKQIFYELKGCRYSNEKFSKQINSNIKKVFALQESGISIKIIYMNDFYRQLKDENVYGIIENLENRNYAATKKLIKHQ
jgi:hypothetical protein